MSYPNNKSSNTPPYLLSAYGIWLKLGNSGTEQDFINSLKGETGAYPRLQFNEDTGYLQKRYDDTGEWENIVSLEDLMTEGETAVVAAAKEFADLSQAYANGTVHEDDENVPVSSGDPGYHDNAEYYKDEAANQAQHAATFASGASGYATAAAGSASEASGYADNASHSAEAAASSALEANVHQLSASASAGSAATSANTAQTQAGLAGTYAYNADQSAQSAANYAASANAAYGAVVTAANNASTSASAASTSAEQAASYLSSVQSNASKAEAYAAGTRGGTPVGSSDEAYHNNAAWYATQAANAQTAAEAAAETAAEDAAEDAVAAVSATFDARYAPISAVGSPLTAATAAGMTDQTKVYVYTGSETGYTAGNWYYYNGSAWTSGGVYNSTAFETDTTLAVSGAAADAKKTGDEITNLKSANSNNHDFDNATGGYQDYDNATDMNYTGTAGAGNSSCLSVTRRGNIITLDGGNISDSRSNYQVVFVKLTGTPSRTNNQTTVNGWNNGITLTPGKTYAVTTTYISGTISGTNATRANVSVYKLGTHSTLGKDKAYGLNHIRYFVADSDTINLTLRANCYNVLYTNFKICVTLQEVNDNNVDYFCSDLDVGVDYKNVNIFPTQWAKGGVGANGEDYDDRSTSIRLPYYALLNDLYSISFLNEKTGYIALYNASKSFLERITATTTTYYAKYLKILQPTAVYYRVEIGGVEGDISGYSNVEIKAKKYLYSIERHDEDRERAFIFQHHRTGSEEFDKCGFKAMLVSDVHAEMQRFGNVIALMNHWGSDLFNCLINCGDTARTIQSNLPAIHDRYIQELQVPYIDIVGNHDAWSSLSHLGDQATTYSQVIAPIAGQTGIVQPTDAATNSLCYYYWDYNNYMRIIALDCMYWNADEATWLENVLADAKTNNLFVIALCHYGFATSEATPMPSIWNVSPGGTSDPMNIVAAQKVNAFIEGGGKFVCWLVGHSHTYNLYSLTNYSNQLVVGLPSLTNRAGNLLKDSVNKEAYNFLCATYMTFDDYQHTVRFMRIGSDIDTRGVGCKGLSLNYETRTLLAAW